MRANKIVKLTIILVGLFLLMGFYPAEGAAKEIFEEKFEKTVSLAKDGEVILKNISGNIEVKSWDKGEVKIEALKVSKASTLSEAEENAKRVEILVKKEDKILRIDTKYQESQNLFRKKSLNVSINYNLLIPAKASAKINSVSGNVDLEEIGGAAKVHVVSGDVGARKTDKGVDCETVSGNLEIRDIAGDAYLKTVSGDITVERIKGSINAEVVSGNIELMAVSDANVVEGKSISGAVIYQGKIKRGGRYTLKSHSGNVSMTLPADSGFELEAKTFSGNIESDFEITVSGQISKRKISGVVNEGGAVVKLSTFSGDISLRKK